jgi:hypothetical protein
LSEGLLRTFVRFANLCERKAASMLIEASRSRSASLRVNPALSWIQVLKFFPLFFLFSLPALSAPDNPVFDDAFHHLYSFDFQGAQSIIDRYIADNPNDPMGYTVKAATYVYSEFDRMGILESDFFESDKSISDSRHKLKPDPQAHDQFYLNIEKAQSLTLAALDKSPNDAPSLFALSLTLGELGDYVALVEKHQLASLNITKRAYRTAKTLLAIDGSYYDAYLTTGFTEYLVGSLPGIVRWFVKFDDVEGDKAKGFRTLDLVATKGNYLKALAKILMAAGYIREKKPLQAQKLLADLTTEYPANPLLKREYQKISVRIQRGS